MPVFSDIISLSYAKTIAGVAQSVTTSDVRLAALVTACSVAVASYCGRGFMPAYHDERYNGSGVGFLMLRTSPVIEIKEIVIGPSTDNPLVYDAADLDVDASISKVSFKPSTTANFFADLLTGTAFPSGISSVNVTYWGGYGAITSVALAAAVGTRTCTPAAMYGRTTIGDLWAIDVGSMLIVDSGLDTEEAVTVTEATSTTFTAIFTRPHAAAFRVLIPAMPADLQSAVGMMVSNLYRQKDLTKSSERLDQYAYTLRETDRGVAFTKEVTDVLQFYKSAFSG